LPLNPATCALIAYLLFRQQQERQQQQVELLLLLPLLLSSAGPQFSLTTSVCSAWQQRQLRLLLDFALA
jgi:nitrate/nitrite transporter NarK